MTVKELIIKLLEEPMNSEVRLTIDDPHQDEHGDCSGYVFDIDSVSHEFGRCMIKFTDWRSRTCKFRSPTNCNFCAFHSDCDGYWKEGDENEINN